MPSPHSLKSGCYGPGVTWEVTWEHKSRQRSHVISSTSYFWLSTMTHRIHRDTQYPVLAYTQRVISGTGLRNLSATRIGPICGDSEDANSGKLRSSHYV